MNSETPFTAISKLTNLEKLICKKHGRFKDYKPYYIQANQIIMLCNHNNECKFPLNESNLEEYIFHLPESCKFECLGEIMKIIRKNQGKLDNFMKGILEYIASRNVFLPLKCWCNCVICIIILSFYILSIPLKLKDPKNGEYLFIDTIQLFTTISNDQFSCFFCPKLGPCIGISPDVIMKNIFQAIYLGNYEHSQVEPTTFIDFFHTDQLITFYCPNCKFQKIIKQTDSILVALGLCTYISLDYIKTSWSCVKCKKSDNKAICEIKYKIAEQSCVFIAFTNEGISTLSILKNMPISDTDTYSLINGRFVIKYVVIEENRLLRVLPFDIIENDIEIFPPAAVKAIVWHHTNPSSRACKPVNQISKTWENSVISMLGPMNPPQSQNSNKTIGIVQKNKKNKKNTNCKGVADFEGYKLASRKKFETSDENIYSNKIENIYINPTDNYAYSEFDQLFFDLDSTVLF